MSAAQDPNVQRRGVVGITFCASGDDLIMDDSLVRHASAMAYAMPYRLMAYHVVVQDPTVCEYFQKVRYFMDPDSRMRIRFHSGASNNIREYRKYFMLLTKKFVFILLCQDPTLTLDELFAALDCPSLHLPSRALQKPAWSNNPIRCN